MGNLCRDRVLIGVHVPGAFADFVRVPAADARVLPDGVSARVGALMEPLANGVHAVRLGARARAALVIGAGTIGLVTLQAALLSGFEHVAVAEPHESPRARSRPGLPPRRPRAARRPRDRRGRARRPRAGSGSSGCGPAGRWSASGWPTTTRRSASTT